MVRKMRVLLGTWDWTQVSRAMSEHSNHMPLGFNPWSRHTKDFKMVFDTSLLNTQQYKVRIKGKVELSRERSIALPYTSV